MAETTQAWVLRRKAVGAATAPFALERFDLPDLIHDEVLIEPLFGCWEGNYGHAIEAKPIDVCRTRKEDAVVLGNCGVVRLLSDPTGATQLKEGQICVLLGNGVWDHLGYMKRAHAYDAPGTIGILAKRSKARGRQLLPLAGPIDASELKRWAAFSLRYVTAWANWRVAYGAWRLQVPQSAFPEGFTVVAWGGGVALAELQLAKHFGASVLLIATHAQRHRVAHDLGIETIDRKTLGLLPHDPEQYDRDPEYRRAYNESETEFLREIRARTDGRGASIFVDNIGTPVARASIRALERQGVLATSGWKHGMKTSYLRASMAIQRQNLIHTHYASFDEAVDAMAFARQENWLPPQDALGPTALWSDIGALATRYLAGQIDSYFPTFEINPI